ncbi:P-loop containing nucleoside triphosphate hydrolase protein [Myriangium duriaei CBS 260.36]|uniref:P-loop containing nucleoside triphosphate hydrolase protein n=1 Tax=Myriangium duriaei CBS 260.36 TaxID=1168546 RepID=A0A9P4MG36_9PEZI|nr:P-loop containing nucleoside triphosphate hydrolase protein [Myriangium duriaei CBS 260.36]
MSHRPPPLPPDFIDEQLRVLPPHRRRIYHQLARMARHDKMDKESTSEGSDSTGHVIYTPKDSTTDSSPPCETAKTAENGKSSDATPDGGDSKSPEQKETVTEKLDPKLVGMSSGLKHLYSGKEDRKGRFQWQSTIPEDVGKPAEDAETQKWALLVRHIKVYNDPEKVLAVHSIVIQSPLLKEVLKGVLKGYPGVTVGLQKLEFGKDFEPLIHRWPQLKAAIADLRKKVAENEADGKDDSPKCDDVAEAVESTKAVSCPDANAKDAAKEDTVDDSTNEKSQTEQAGSTPVTDIPQDEPRAEKTDQIDKSATELPIVAVAGSEGTDVGEEKSDAILKETIIEGKLPATEESEPDVKVEDAAPISKDKADEPVDPKQEDALKLNHAELFYDLLVAEFQDLIELSQDMMSKGVMTYEYVWTLFQPGAFIFAKVEGQERVFRLHSGRYGVNHQNKPGFWLMLQYVDYDGSRFGYQKLNVFLGSWAGTRPISSLSGYPLEFHKEKDELRTKLIARGAKVESLAGSHYKAYDGIGWRYDYRGQKEKFSIKGRIVVDTHGWNKNVPNNNVYVTAFNRDNANNTGSDGSYDSSSDDDEYCAAYDDDMEDGMPVDGHFVDEDDENNKDPLSDDHRLMCSHLVRGYALKQKRWVNLYVSSVSDISFNTRAFESLVLSESQKDLILGFTSSQQASRHQFDDVIEGKGRGIILLLCGPPGVGKTLTAESVAEEMQVPLFVMSAGDVGFDNHVESRLLDVFEMVTRWNAILLLDEADVFLEERSMHEIERNKIVSIFLRVLEYYEGIMFLTTNRVHTFDQAFQSRIHISLDYPELSIESRKQVWKNFLAQHDIVQKASRERGPPKSPSSNIKREPSKEGLEKEDKAQAEGTTTDIKDDATSKDSEEKPDIEEVKEDINDKFVVKEGADAEGFKVSADSSPAAKDGDTPEAPSETPEEASSQEKKDDTSPPLKEDPNTTDGTSSPPSSATEEKSPTPTPEQLEEHKKRTQPHSMTDREIDSLARMHMNGRQIKNVLKTAQLLAQRRGESLSKKHIQTVLEVTQHLHNESRESARNRSAIFC